MTDLDMVKSGYYRLVRNPRRAAKLRKRGECIKWSCELNGWIWERESA